MKLLHSNRHVPAESKWKTKDKGYTEDPSGIAKMDVILPMLAEKYKERKKYMRYPCFHQPKQRMSMYII